MIRSPILCLLGHVDAGKTSLIDRIRGTAVAKGEPGLITQHISASYVPIDMIKKMCGSLLKKMGISLTIPGLLWIDTPGHEAFVTLRKRGGAIADLAVLVVDIIEGFQPQTEESLNFLKQFKTAFVVAANKIDRVPGWIPNENACFLDSFKEQSSRVQDKADELIYRVVGQLSALGFISERYDRIKDYTHQISIVPVSAKTGEGVPDLLMVLSGIAEKYMKSGLEIAPEMGKATVLEVKEFKGMGVTIDVIVYDGSIRRGDYLVIGGGEKDKITVTKIRALLQPSPLRELKAEKNFQNVESVTAAAGIKIFAPDLEKAIAGSPVRSVRGKDHLDKAKKEIEEEIEEVEILTDREGVIIKADTLGALEAMSKTLKGMNIQIRKAVIGTVTRVDILEAKILQDPVVFAFNVKIPDEILKFAKDSNVFIFTSDVIYRLVEDYQKWEKEKAKRKEENLLENTVHPGRIRILPKLVFRQSRPAIFGTEVILGVIKAGYKLSIGGRIVGEVKEIQKEGTNIGKASKGDKVAISIEGAIIGKHFKEGDHLDVFLTDRDLEALKKVLHRLRPDEIELLKSYKVI